MPTNDRGDLGRTKLCRLCKMRCTKGRDFYDPTIQTGDREKYLARIACTFCVSHMIDRGEVEVSNGVLTVHKVLCRHCGLMRFPNEMTGLYWCKKCCARDQRARQARKPKVDKPTKRQLLDKLFRVHEEHNKTKKSKCRCAVCITVREWRIACEKAEEKGS